MSANADSPRPTPIVSVIMIFLNGERFIAEAIESVVAQTRSDWELLLVDDGSTDRSTSIAQQYAARDPERVRYLSHPEHANRGMSASRNLGAAHSRGRYIAFLDADDVYLPERLARHVSELESRPDVDAVFTETLRWYEWPGHDGNKRINHVRMLKLTPGRTYEPGEVLIPWLRQEAFTPATCSIVIRRAAFDRVGGFEETFRGLYEDQAFLYKLFLHSRTLMIDGVFDYYRAHRDSVVAVGRRQGEYRVDDPSPSRRRFVDWFAAYLAHQSNVGLRLRWSTALIQWLEHHPSAGRAVRRLVNWRKRRSELPDRQRAATSTASTRS